MCDTVSGAEQLNDSNKLDKVAISDALSLESTHRATLAPIYEFNNSITSADIHCDHVRSCRKIGLAL